MTQHQLLQKIEKWLSKKGNTKAELARRLGYRNSTTITHWFRRGRLPMYRSIEILNVMNKHFETYEALENNQLIEETQHEEFYQGR